MFSPSTEEDVKKGQKLTFLMEIVLGVFIPIVVTISIIQRCHNLKVGIEQDREYSELEKRAAVIADVNKDGKTTIDEWKKVYRFLNIHYNELNSLPLTLENLRRYTHYR